jgi:hypothetical protein
VEDIRRERVRRQLKASLKMLILAQQEAEALVDQQLADDLMQAVTLLREISRHAERKRYVTPGHLDIYGPLYVSAVPRDTL